MVGRRRRLQDMYMKGQGFVSVFFGGGSFATKVGRYR